MRYELITQTLLEGATKGWARERVVAKDQARRVFDSARFKAEHPELWESYSRTVTSKMLALVSSAANRKSMAPNGTPVTQGDRPETETFATFANASAAAKALAKQGILARVLSYGHTWRVIR